MTDLPETEPYDEAICVATALHAAAAFADDRRGTVVADLQPDNGTRYVLAITRLTGHGAVGAAGPTAMHHSADALAAAPWLLSVVNLGVCLPIAAEGYANALWLADMTGLRLPDARPVAAFLTAFRDAVSAERVGSTRPPTADAVGGPSQG